MTLRSIPKLSSQLIEQACKRSKKKAFHFSFSDLSSGQQYTLFYSTNTSHAWNELKEEGKAQKEGLSKQEGSRQNRAFLSPQSYYSGRATIP